MQETPVWFLGWEDPLEKGKVTHSSMLAWKIPWAQELAGLQSMGLQRVKHVWATNTQASNSKCIFSPIKCAHSTLNSKKKKKESTCNAGDPGSIPGSGRSTGEEIVYSLQYSWASLLAQLVKNLPAMQETWVWSLGWEDPLEKGKATHSSILAWRIPWTIPWDLIESNTTERLSLSLWAHLGCEVQAVP